MNWVRLFAGLGLVLSLSACDLLCTNDGLPPHEWEARERRIAGRSLPELRRSIRAADARAVATYTPTRPILAEISSPFAEEFFLGGVAGFNGPRYCHRPFGPRSAYILSRQHLWATPEGVFLLRVQGSIDNLHAQNPNAGRPAGDVVEVPYADLAEITHSDAVPKQAFRFAGSSSVSIASKRLNTVYVVILPYEERQRVRQFFDVVQARTDARKRTSSGARRQ